MVAVWNKLSDPSDKIRVKVPNQCRVGEIIEIRTLIKHSNETGNKKNSLGQVVPKNIIKYLRIFFDDQVILSAEFGPGISENPFISCFMRVTGRGNILIVWEDERGTEWSKDVPLNVM